MAAAFDAGANSVWAHGRASPVTAALSDHPLIRELWQLRRGLGADEPPPDAPESVTIRPFAVGRDEAAWLAVNAAAFAHHPEQGRWTRADLEAREAEPWFSPAGFLLAERDGALVGFHWTKQHSAQVGEVYVLAVAPQAQGLHLGGALLRAGLAHLADSGVRTVLLYVDGDNEAALRLYERGGFTRFDRDAQYGP